MDQQLVIKLTSGDGNGVPVGMVESPPMLYTNFKTLYPTVTFSEKATASEIEPYWYGVFDYNYETPTVEHTKTAEDVGLTKHSDNVWRKTFVIRDATQEEINQRTEEQSYSIRRIRDKLLIRSDYTQATDHPQPVNDETKKQAWAGYRQKLRDLPLQNGFPWNVEFPVAPE
jgi:hypothetical protein